MCPVPWNPEMPSLAKNKAWDMAQPDLSGGQICFSSSSQNVHNGASSLAFLYIPL